MIHPPFKPTTPRSFNFCRSLDLRDQRIRRPWTCGNPFIWGGSEVPEDQRIRRTWTCGNPFIWGGSRGSEGIFKPTPPRSFNFCSPLKNRFVDPPYEAILNIWKTMQDEGEKNRWPPKTLWSFGSDLFVRSWLNWARRLIDWWTDWTERGDWLIHELIELSLLAVGILRIPPGFRDTPLRFLRKLRARWRIICNL